MKKFKVVLALLLIMLFVTAASACANGNNAAYESIQSFAFYFYPEEYEAEYNEISKTLLLETGKDYQIAIEAACTRGCMEIRVFYNDEEMLYTVNADTPCNNTIAISAATNSEVKFIVSINPDTQGSVIGELFIQT